MARDGLTDSSRFCNVIALLYGISGDFFSSYDKPCTGKMTKLMLFSDYSDLFLYSKFRYSRLAKLIEHFFCNWQILVNFLLRFAFSYTFQGCSF